MPIVTIVEGVTPVGVSYAQSYNQGQDFWPSEMAVTAWLHQIFASNPPFTSN